jgi:hypothetical protein
MKAGTIVLAMAVMMFVLLACGQNGATSADDTGTSSGTTSNSTSSGDINATNDSGSSDNSSLQASSDGSSNTGNSDNTNANSTSSSATKTSTSTATSTSSTTSNAYKAVLAGNTTFYSDAGKNININQLNQVIGDGSAASVEKFAVIDLDGDGSAEVVLWPKVGNNDSLGFIILRCSGGTVYGYTMYYRTFNDLKVDGTFSFSSGAGDHGFGKISFTNSGYSVQKITYCESVDSSGNQVASYFVDQKSCGSSEFDKAISQQGLKTDVTWNTFTDSNINSVFP